MLTSDGMLDHQKILDYIQDVMKPDEVKKPLVDGTDQCIKDHGMTVNNVFKSYSKSNLLFPFTIPIGSKVKNDKDPNCLSYMEVGLCVHDIFLEVNVFFISTENTSEGNSIT